MARDSLRAGMFFFYQNRCNWQPEDIEALQFEYARATAQASVDLVREQWQGALPVLQDLGLEMASMVCGMTPHMQVHTFTFPS